MKYSLLLILALPVAALAQNVNNYNPPQVQVQYANPPANQNIQQESNGEIEEQIKQNKNDWDVNQNQNDNIGTNKDKDKPCDDCEEIKKKLKQNVSSGVAGNYSGGANKFKRKRQWRKFWYDLTHRSGGKKSRPNLSVCFNW